MAYPEPTEVAPWYLRNITQALALDQSTGNVYVRTDAVVSIGNVGNLVISNVGISSLGNIDITGNTMPVAGNVGVTQITSPWVVSGNVNASVVGTVTTAIEGTNLDAFGRLRVSNPVTLFDSNNLYLASTQFANLNSTGGTYTYVQNESSFNMAVTAANNSSVITQAKSTQAYQPGKSLLALESFAFGELKANCRQRVGYFTSANGVYFEADGTTLYLVIRSSTSGTVVEERIAQADWNTDTLKTGVSPNPSGYNLDPTLTNIFWCDIEWLGVGTVRSGFVINGEFVVCHKFNHANQAGNTKVYMTTAVLNPRYEITNTGNTTGTTTMKQICSTVISEGGYQPQPAYKYTSNGTSTTRISAANTVTALCAVRVNPAYPDAVVKIAQVDFLVLDVRYGQIQVIKNPTLAGISWSNVSNSVMQTATIANTITDGSVEFAVTASSRADIAIEDGGLSSVNFGRDVNGNTDVIVLAASFTQSNSDVLYKLAWNEFTNN
jgi:hypothetical protein